MNPRQFAKGGNLMRTGRRILCANPQGMSILTFREGMRLSGVVRSTFTRQQAKELLESLGDAYIDRWDVIGESRYGPYYEPIWRLAFTPADATKPALTEKQQKQKDAQHQRYLNKKAGIWKPN